MQSLEMGRKSRIHGVIRGTTYVKPVTVVVQQRWKETWNSGDVWMDMIKTKKRPSGKGKDGHGESHRPRVRIGESQLPVREEIGESQ